MSERERQIKRYISETERERVIDRERQREKQIKTEIHLRDRARE